jgi:hypothetical protein
MKVLKTAIEELFGLFVEDGTLAIGILFLVALAVFALPHSPIPEAFRAPLLFLGLVVLLLENVLRAGKK